MTEWFLRYGLQDGFVHNWLVAGPTLVSQNGRQSPASVHPEVPAPAWLPAADMVDPPCERAQFTLIGPDGAATKLTWRYLRCEEDHLLDPTRADSPAHPQRAWAYTELVSPRAQQARLTLHSFAPVQAWLNGQLVLSHPGHDAGHLQAVAADVDLAKQPNALLVRLDWATDDAVPLALALHVRCADARLLKVQLPTQNPKPQLHHEVERIAQRAYVERDLYAGPEAIHVKWPKSIRAQRPMMLRVEKPAGAIVGEAQPVAKAGLSQHLFEGTWAKDGRFQVKVLPSFEEFIRGLRVGYDLDVNILHGTYADEPRGEQPERGYELLKHAAWWTDGVFAQLAAMALGEWKHVNQRTILQAMEEVRAQHEKCHETLVGLFLMAYRYAADPAFPPALALPLEECLLGFDYASYDASSDADGGDGQGIQDDTAIVRHACSVLAGQLYADRPFACNGQPGSWHRKRGEERAAAWFARRAQGGFAAWGSGEGFAAMLLGMITLVDHAESEALSDLAAGTIDKLLYTLALNSFRGVFGCSHGVTSAASITDARMEPTSPIGRLLWGVGCWNQHMAAGFVLATSMKYGCPPLQQMIALDRPDALWSRERHATAWRASSGGLAVDGEVNTATFKTPDFMLCSAQDYRPGEAGGREHIWQATLSPSAVVFVNHPRCVNQKDVYPANFWRGNGVLPRAAQWRDLLIALYRLPANDWLGYTHAHFPIAAFDEYAIRRGWAFARKADGYLALTASAGMKLIKDGPGAYRELRSAAPQTVWLCQMGRAAQDGSFADFQAAVLAMPVTFDGLDVALQSVRGEAVDFGWSRPFLVQGEAQPLSGFPHYASPHCECEFGATEMEMKYGEWLLRLNLS